MFSEQLSVLLASIKSSNDSPIKFYILSDYISHENKQKISNTILNCNITLQFIIESDFVNPDFKIDKHASLANYFRIYLPKFLPPTIDKIIYLDSDTIVLGRLDELWNSDIKNYALAAVEYTNVERIKALQLDSQKYINSGVLVVNLKDWRERNFTEIATDFITRNPQLVKFWDQDAINVLLEQNIKYLDIKWNYCGVFSKDLNIKILHFVGIHKPCSKHYKKNANKRLYYRYLLKTPYWRIKYFRHLI